MKIPSRHFRFPLSARRFSRSGFTMIEIALCLAIIGFALVAIIGVLPAGLNVQKDNREETIINQDAVVWMNAIRNGAQGFDDLTNYVTGITNNWTYYTVIGNVTNGAPAPNNYDGYSFQGARVTSVAGIPTTYHLSGTNIIGLLSTPKYFELPPSSANDVAYQSNYIYAYVRAMSGSAVEKAPQGNQTILDNAFTYKLIVENIPYVPFDSVSTNYSLYPSNTPEWSNAFNQHRVALNLMTNSHDLRLTFRWPVLPNGDIGNGRVTFRASTGGWLLPTNDVYETRQPLFFFQSSTYVK